MPVPLSSWHRPWRSGAGLLLACGLMGACAGPASVPTDPTPLPSSSSGSSSSSSSSSDDAPSRPPTGSSTSGGAGCPVGSTSPGPAGALVVVAISAPATATAGSTVTVSSQLVVLGEGPRIVLRPQASSLEVLRGSEVVARTTSPAGPDVPLPLTAGSSFPGQTLPARVALVGCDGVPLAPGAYRLRAVVGYGGDPLNGAASGASGAFVLISDPPVDLTIT